MAYLEIKSCGAYGSVQDLGRHGSRHLGIPQSGALDEFSAMQANLICGNNENDAVLELIGPGWELLFLDEAIITICGADFDPHINLERVQMEAALFIRAGSVLHLKKNGVHRIAYIAVKGGFHTEIIYGSRSWHPLLSEPWILKKHTLISYFNTQSIVLPVQSNIKMGFGRKEISTIKAFPGPEYSQMAEDAIQCLLYDEWTLSSKCSRMAYLFEEKLPESKQSILTSAVWPGIVQLTPSGQMIVLMKDSQTTGGYPRILSIGSDALYGLAQRKPGQKIRWDIQF